MSQHKQNLQEESGRSMIEMLGVLAVMGVLAVTSVIGIKYMMDKRQANEILRDAHMAYVNHESSRDSDTEWHSIGFTPKVDLDFSYRHDGLGYCFVKVDQVPQKVCEIMLQSKEYANLYFFTERNQIIKSCLDAENNMIMAFDGVDGIAIPCQNINDCPENISYCEQETGFCRICGRDYHLSRDKTKCLPNCQENETECLIDRTGWCCPNTLICGDKVGECAVSNGLCQYDVSLPEKIERKYDCSYQVNVPTQLGRQYDCSYQVKVPTQLGRKYDCSYQVKVPTQLGRKYDCSYQVKVPTQLGRKYDCSYRVGSYVEGKGNSMTPQKTCPSGQYCALSYDDEGCSKGAVAEKEGILYGSCHEWTLSNQGCPRQTSQEELMTPQKTCPSGQYCALSYDDEGCSKGAVSEKEGILYGSCHEWTISNQGCPRQTSQEELMIPQKTCPSGQYCALVYDDEGCAKGASSEKEGIVYGSCHEWTLSNQGCPLQTSQEDLMTPQKTCPSGQYCALAYDDEGCAKGASSEKEGILYGSCHEWTLSNQGCPLQTSQEELMTPQKTCPSGQYCALAYDDEGCSTGAVSEKEGILYGSCHEWTLSNQGCPLQTSQKELMKPVLLCPGTHYCSLNWEDQECHSAVSEHSGPLYGACRPLTEGYGSCPYR